MIIYPAIDVLDGEVVRLHQGDFGAVSRYGRDPLEIARAYRDQGAAWIHVVDLSGARDGQRRQSAVIAKICSTGLRVQTGGGVRISDDVRQLYQAGVERVVVGSLAITQPGTVKDWLGLFGAEHLALAFDGRFRDGVFRPAISGWREDGNQTLDRLMTGYVAAGLRHALVTDIDRDGALTGVNLPLYQELVSRYPSVDWQASGGVAGTADIQAVDALGLSGVIIGKALYENKFTLEEVLACSQNA
jgi:phosphoribosylformimino-5-aminoimidazole carboxamide ribotide isomerase